MKVLTISLLTLIISAEAFAQRGPQPGRGPMPAPGRVDPAPRPTRPTPAPAPGRYDPAPRPTRPTPAPVPGRYDPVPSRPLPGPGRYDPYPTRPYRPHPPVVVVPRYLPNPYTPRYYRPAPRPVITWHTGFGYQCTPFGELVLNGRYVHQFRFTSDCHQALIDIRHYGDFCDGENLYDQSGILEAQFYFNYECREALGWYY